MNTHGSPEDDSAETADFFRRLQHALEHTAAPVAAHAGFAMALIAGGRPTWIVPHSGCVCTEGTFDTIELSHREHPVGSVLFCPRGQQLALEPVVQRLVTVARDQVEREFEDEDLLRELGASWESLDTIYEVAADLQGWRNPQDVLPRILDRIAARRPTLRAALWIEIDGMLEPVATTRVEIHGARDMREGLIGRALRDRTSLVVSGRTELLAEDGIEPELRRASHVAIVPIATRQRLVGALEVWEEAGQGGFDSSSIRLFEALALQAAHVVEGDRAHQGTLERERLRSEIEIGGRIQETLLWDRLPPRLPGVQIASFAKPSHVIDGDFCEFFPLGDRCLDIVIGDVMGKGVPAALIGAAVKSGLLRALGQLTVSSLATQRPEPRSVVGAVHDHLTGQLIALESFVSLSYNRFDFEHRRLDFVSCGHPRTMHVHGSNGIVHLLDGPNLPLGVLDGEAYEQTSIAFEAGDVFLLYSDGVTEARNAAGEQFGERRLVDWLTANRMSEPAALCGGVWDAVRAFTGTEEVSDDLTCVAVRVTGLDPSAPAICWAIEFTSELGSLSALRAWVRAACHADRAPDPQALALLELAVAEAATNIIRHAYEGAAGRPVRIVVEVEDGKATVTLMHWGSPFQPPPEPPTPPEVAGERGRGLFIISRAVDQVTYQNCPNGASSVRLVKHLGPSVEAGGRMLVTMVRREDVAVVSIADGSLDASNAKRFKQEVIPALESVTRVVLDLSGVEFVDSSGLGVILSCYRQLVSAGGDLKLCGMAPSVRALFELVRMHRIFDTYPTREEAIAAFRPPPS